MGFKTRNILRALLGSVKDKINVQDKSGVYKLKCSCGYEYCGQTGKKFRERIEEHQEDFRENKGTSIFAKYLKESNHTYYFDLTDRQFVEFLHFCPEGGMLNALEKSD